MPDRSLLRVGGVAGITGGVLAIVANGGHPRFPIEVLDGDTEALLEEVATFRPWEVIHFLAIVAVFLFLATFIALTGSVGERGTTWGKLGLGAAGVSVTVAIIALVVDGLALGLIADSLEGASDRGLVLAAGEGVVAVSSTTFAIWQLLLVGVTPGIYGLAIGRGGVYPRYLAWVGILAGILGVASGLIHVFAGFTIFGFLVLFSLASVLTTIFIILIGWHQLRMAREHVGSVRLP